MSFGRSSADVLDQYFCTSL